MASTSTPASYCIQFLKNACPFGENCSRRHDITECSCGLILLSENRFAHLNGKRHREMYMAKHGRPSPPQAQVFDVEQQHTRQGNSPDTGLGGSRSRTSQTTLCSCGLVLLTQYYDAHVTGRRHVELYLKKHGRLTATSLAQNDSHGSSAPVPLANRYHQGNFNGQRGPSTQGGHITPGRAATSTPQPARSSYINTRNSGYTPRHERGPGSSSQYHQQERLERTLHTRAPTHLHPFQDAPIDDDDAAEAEDDQEEELRCETCRRLVPDSQYDSHVEEHLRQQRLQAAQIELDEAADDKEGVVVQGRKGIDFGILDLDLDEEGGNPSRGKAVEVEVKITSHEVNVSLLSAKMLSAAKKENVVREGSEEPKKLFKATLRGKGKFIKPSSPRILSVTFFPFHAGRVSDTLELVFANLHTGSIFVIVRDVSATVGSKEVHELLKPVAPYTGGGRRQMVKLDWMKMDIVHSLRPPAWSKTEWKERLEPFFPPKALIEAVYGKPGKPTKGEGAAGKILKKFLPAVLNITTYAKWFQVLLYLEEEKMKLDLDMYSMIDVELRPNHPRYDLLVQGLAENRPSVLVGDFILVSHSTDPSSTDDPEKRRWYEGRVHKVHANHVSLRFNDDFSVYRGTRFDVKFVLNRLPFRRMHSALVNKNDQARILFPEPRHVREEEKGEERERKKEEIKAGLSPVYRPILQDEEQMDTVAAILSMKEGSVPFIVFGPPGTGKTVTLVESIHQLLSSQPNIRILACAPNNSAADLLASKFKTHLSSTELLRLNSLSRKLDDMPKELHPFSLINDNQLFVMPTLTQVRQYRLIVATCLSAGVPASLGLEKGWFEYIFVDEAGQGKEPEVVLPLKMLCDERTRVVLAGDRQQLGPVVHCGMAKRVSGGGLGMSLLERLMQREGVYGLKAGAGKGVTITKLLKNFRSHPSILQFPNNMFYEDELRPAGDHAITHNLETWDELPKKRFPILFHGIVGKDEREAFSPSFFNVDEVTWVRKYVQNLLGLSGNSGKKGLNASHIGIITPYHAQRCKISLLLSRDPKTRDIKVGSVEEFQGQERRVIILSTVRSNTEFVGADIRRSLGFVADRKRLNVAITRAQALLIVIGNPIVLSLDPLWRGFMNYIHRNGGWKGKEIDWDPVIDSAADNSGVNADNMLARRKAEADGEVEETVERIRAMICKRLEDDGFDLSSLGLSLGGGDDEGDEDEEAGAFERPILREAE